MAKINLKHEGNALTSTELDCRERFLTALAAGNYKDDVARVIDGNEIAQCINDKYNPRYYAPNYFSVATSDLLRLKDDTIYLCDIGKQTDSVQATDNNNVKYKRGICVINPATGKSKGIAVWNHILCALYHATPWEVAMMCDSELATDVHHIRTFDHTAPYYVNDCIGNLQVIRKNVNKYTVYHQSLHAMNKLIDSDKTELEEEYLDICLVMRDSDGREVNIYLPHEMSPHQKIEYMRSKNINPSVEILKYLAGTTRISA